MPELEHVGEMQEKTPVDFWEIIETYVAGIMYNDRHLIVRCLALREQVCLRRELGNADDPNAIKVEKQNEKHFGLHPA